MTSLPDIQEIASQNTGSNMRPTEERSKHEWFQQSKLLRDEFSIRP